MSVAVSEFSAAAHDEGVGCHKTVAGTDDDEKALIDNKSNDYILIKESKETMVCEEVDMCNGYVCGGCGLGFPTICKLHSHLKTHGYFGSYYYSEYTKTAYPKFQSCSISIQTDDDRSNVRSRKRKWKSSNKTYDKLLREQFEDINEAVRNQTREADDISELSNEMKDIISKDKQTLDSDLPEDFGEEERFDVAVSSQIEENKSLQNGKHADKKIFKTDINGKNLVKTDRKNLEKANKGKMNIKLVDNSLKEMEKLPMPNDVKNIPHIEVKKLGVKFICKLCHIAFEKRTMLRSHIRCKHLDVALLCSFCAEVCKSETELIEHRKTLHNQGYHKCELCGQVLSTKSMLEGHYLVHKGIKPFSCDICSPKREFTRKSQLKSHMETHSKEKNLQCEFCGKPFNARYLMMNHVKHCAGIKPYHCEFCEMKFVSNHCLQRHRRIHTGEKPFVCEICAFASSNASCLARHIRTHTGEKPFECKHCSQCFAAPGALRKHVRIHTQEKPYKCRYCVKAFTQNWNLKTHERQHTGETPYRCHVCGIGYKQNVLLKTHLKTHCNSNLSHSEAQSTEHVSTVNHSSVSQLTGSEVDNIKNVPPDQLVSAQSDSQMQLHQNTVSSNLLMTCLIQPNFSMNR